MLEDIQKHVTETERAFARSMAERDFEAFLSFLADDAIFFGETPLRGKQQVAEQWQGFYRDPKPPFSWEPRLVEVLESGDLALSTGPVYNPDGKHVATFNSVWRREQPGIWRIVFDIGYPVCEKP
jgi:ketosteroid isomerase-like protein